MTIPTKYKWIENEAGPKMILEALKMFGTVEFDAAADNPVIIAWATEVGRTFLVDEYLHDVTPWCGLFMAVVAKRAGKDLPVKPLWALNWKNFGKKSPQAMFGDVIVFKRITPEGNIAGHVGLYVGESETQYFVLGGNQSDEVSITAKDKSRAVAVRRPKYNVQPANVRQILLDADGNSSGSEQ
jgi:uncharacterized protein (TIGR02594 family)